MSSTLKSHYKWVATPFITNAPMGGFAGPALASAVTSADSLGFIGAVDMGTLDAQLEAAKKSLSSADGVLRVGVGFLCFLADLDIAAEAVRKHRPAAVWLFAAHDLSDYVVWIKRMRDACPETTIWIQNNSVADSLAIARTCSPDVLVVQGTDAGGHGHAKGAGIISLLPEVADALAAAGFGRIPLVAAGGIVEGRGAAAALALGAAGVVMGTRFLATKEVRLPDKGYQDLVLAASDGGQSTVRSKFFDDLNPGGNIWPVLYDGRSLRNASLEDYTKGMSIEENRRLHEEAEKTAGKGFRAQKVRVTVWAGTGIGLVKEVSDAASIVRRVRDDSRSILRSLSGRL